MTLYYFVNDDVILQWIFAKNKVARFLSRRFFRYIYWSLNFSTESLSSTITLPLSISIISFCVWQLLLVRKALKKFQNDLCDKSFLSNILKVWFNVPSPQWDILVSLGLKQKFIFVRWIFPKFVSETTLFIYFFPKFSVDKRCMIFSVNLPF